MYLDHYLPQPQMTAALCFGICMHVCHHRIFYSTLPQGSPTIRLLGATAGVMSVAFSPDSQLVLGCANDHISRVWDTKGEIRVFEQCDISNCG